VPERAIEESAGRWGREGRCIVLTLPTIDAHHYFWDPGRRAYPWLSGDLAALQRPFGPEDLRPELESEGITGSVLVQVLPSLEESRDLLALAAETPFVLGVVGWVDLTAPDVPAAIADLRAGSGGERLVGLQHPVHDEIDADWLTRADVRRGLAAVAAAGLAFDLTVRTRELPAAVATARALPELRFVLDHLARPPIASGHLAAWGRALLALAELPNVSAKLSGLLTEAVRRTWSIDDLRHPVELALDAFGPRRLMLGSDWPVCLLAGSYSDAIDPLRYLVADLPTWEQQEICGGTAARVYRLNRAAGGAHEAPRRR
jgi:L-fuconolactonase